MQRLTGCLISHFYSRPCGRGDSANGARYEIGSISTHAPAGGATTACTSPKQGQPFLLTPLREGRQSPPAPHCTPTAISTHAPAGGATHQKPRSRAAGS